MYCYSTTYVVVIIIIIGIDSVLQSYGHTFTLYVILSPKHNPLLYCIV